MSTPLSDFLDAIAKLPDYNGITFRGLAADATDPPQLGVVAGVLSSSRSARVASENFTAARLLVLLNRTGRSIAEFSAQPGEGEVVVRPGTLWRALIEVRVEGSPVPVLVLEELDPTGSTPAPTEWGDTLDDLAGRVVRLVQQGLADDPAAIAVPGKYVGPWPAQVPSAPPAP